jgi:hypothetical protein
VLKVEAVSQLSRVRIHAFRPGFLISRTCNYRRPPFRTAQDNLRARAAKAPQVRRWQDSAEPYAQLRFDETRASLYSPAQIQPGNAHARPH